MAQCITYTVGDGLYVNMTNRCTCDCDFCLRSLMDAVGDAESLWLEHEPAREEVLDSIFSRDLPQYKELVFCGFGEPTLRADDLLWVARGVKLAMPSLPIRIDTNGHANLIAGGDITPKMAGVIDHLSVSLNYADATAYDLHMRSVFGEAAFDGMLEFVAKARCHVGKITMTVLASLPPEETALCREIAGRLGADFRIRAMY